MTARADAPPPLAHASIGPAPPGYGPESPRLYADLAPWWPWLSPVSDYAAEAAVIRRALLAALTRPHRRGRGLPPSLLELGVGGGHTLFHLAPYFRCTAVDLSPAMLANSRRLNPGVEHRLGDMTHLRLRRRFDAVLLHDALDSMTDERSARAALAAAVRHLRPGGVVVLWPSAVRETFQPGQVEADLRHEEGLEIGLVCHSGDAAEGASFYPLHMAILLRRGGRLSISLDVQSCGLFAQTQWRGWLRALGCRATLRHWSMPGGGRHTYLVAVR